MVNKNYSYQDCWNFYWKFFPERILVDTIQKNDLIALCQTTPMEFWLNFSKKKLNLLFYRKICHKIEQYHKKIIPVAYLNKEIYFAKHMFQVEKGVFIPQRDTEILLEKSCELIKQRWPCSNKLKILDLGTGCGNLAISLAKINPNWQITALDISQKALRMVRKNITLHRVKNVKVIKSNLFCALDPKKKYQAIITNPPYLSKKEYKSAPYLTKQQPKRALLASQSGYEFYQKILLNSLQYLTKKFLIIMETGSQQKNTIIKMIIKEFVGLNSQIKVFVDLSQNDRVIAFYGSQW